MGSLRDEFVRARPLNDRRNVPLGTESPHSKQLLETGRRVLRPGNHAVGPTSVGPGCQSDLSVNPTRVQIALGLVRLKSDLLPSPHGVVRVIDVQVLSRRRLSRPGRRIILDSSAIPAAGLIGSRHPIPLGASALRCRRMEFAVRRSILVPESVSRSSCWCKPHRAARVNDIEYERSRP
jgi:hypothetical protein